MYPCSGTPFACHFARLELTLAQQARTSRSSATTVNRRTLSVWGALVGSMTLATALLIVLEPAPLRPTSGYTLAAVDTGPTTMDAIFELNTPIDGDRWQRIVVHHSGQMAGNARSIHQLHKDGLGYGGLGYHFVIGNGHGSDNGAIEVGYRWVRQVDGVYTPDAISICLVGNGDQAPPTTAQVRQLASLVKSLQQRLGIPASRVHLHRELAQTTSPGQLFPAGLFREQLIN